MTYDIKAYAKVNIGLRVLPRRPDGYHPLRTVFHLISLYDEISIDIEPAEILQVRISGNEGYLPPGGLDIMQRAATSFCLQSGISFTIDIRIRKHIPSQAGLGGGSSDAAAVLKLLNRHFSYPLDDKTMMRLSLAQGSDVPFFTSGYSCAYAEGRGEILSPRPSVSYPVLLVWKKGSAMSTKEAFARLDEREEISDYIGQFPQPLENWRKEFVNDFSPLQELTYDPLFNAAADFAPYCSVSGSGSVFFMVFDNDETRLTCRDTLLNRIGSIDILCSQLYCISDL